MASAEKKSNNDMFEELNKHIPKENREQIDVMKDVLEKMGVPVNIVLKMLTSYYTAHDKIKDCHNFIDNYNKYQKLNELVQLLKQEHAQHSENFHVHSSYWDWLEQAFDFHSKDQCFTKEQIEAINEKYKQMEQIFGNEKTLRLKADEIITSRNWLSSIELLITYAYLIKSVIDYKNTSKLIAKYEQSLKEIEIKYIQPIINSFHENNFDINRIEDQIETCLERLNGMKENITDALSLTQSNFWNNLFNVANAGFNLYSTVSNIYTMTNVASAAVINGQKILAGFQGGACVASAVMTTLHGINWCRLNAIAMDIDTNVKELNKCANKIKLRKNKK